VRHCRFSDRPCHGERGRLRDEAVKADDELILIGCDDQLERMAE